MSMSRFISDDDIKIMLHDLDWLPDQIKGQYDELRLITSKNIENAIAMKEAEITSEVEVETNGDGKKKYTNAESRKNEVTLRVAADPQCQQWQVELAEIKQNRAEREGEIFHAKDRLRALSSKAILVAALLESEQNEREKQIIKERTNVE